MHRLVAVDGSTSALDRSEPEACRDPLLNESVVLLDDVVQIRCRSAATAATEFTGLLQLSDSGGIGRMPVHSGFGLKGGGYPGAGARHAGSRGPDRLPHACYIALLDL